MSVEWETRGPAAWVTFNRPEAHNAMTFEMYEELHACCARADSEDEVRALVLRGAGEKAFVAGTDIRQFLEFSTPEDGLEYLWGVAYREDSAERFRAFWGMDRPQEKRAFQDFIDFVL